jgi:TRAP-type C4-dicarboxylate transport system substrate-binding protein
MKIKVRKLLVLSLVVAVAFVMIACGSGSGSDDKKATNEGGGDDADKTFELKLSYYAAETIPPGQAVLEACKAAEEKSGGRIKITPYFSGTYVSKDDTMASLKTGMIDIAPVEASQIASVAKLNQVFNALLQADLPSDRQLVQDIYVKMIEDIPELNEEMIKNANCLWIYPFIMGGHNLHGNIKVQKVEDIAGKKIEAHGLEGEYVNLLKATAVELDSGDYYNGMKLGTVDAQFMHWAVLNNYQVNEVVKYHTIFGEDEIGSGLAMPCMGYMINKDTWDSLPADLQQVLKESFIIGANYVINADNTGYAEAVTYAKDNGHEFFYIKGDDRKPWADAMTPILEKWYDECDAAGYDAKTVYEEMSRLLNEAAAK